MRLGPIPPRVREPLALSLLSGGIVVVILTRHVAIPWQCLALAIVVTILSGLALRLHEVLLRSFLITLMPSMYLYFAKDFYPSALRHSGVVTAQVFAILIIPLLTMAFLASRFRKVRNANDNQNRATP